ncbi:S-linalool synthase [Bienertia sinuspersici]
MAPCSSHPRPLLPHSWPLETHKHWHIYVILYKAVMAKIKCELAIPWMARMEHLEHRDWIEANIKGPVWWSTIYGLMDMGFAREKSTYCYFAVASTTSLPYDSDVRLIVAKSAILITVFDDYFDMEGSLNELHFLADAVHRWNNKGLKGHSKILFDALDTFVSEIAENYFAQNGVDITDNIRKLKRNGAKQAKFHQWLPTWRLE